MLTDTNRKQLSTWGTVVDNYGYVEQANETPLVDNPAEAAHYRFSPTPGAGPRRWPWSTGWPRCGPPAYSNPITNTAENQPLNVVDGNPDTAWTEGAFSPATDEAIQIKLDHPVTADHISLLQPQTGPRNRTVTNVTLTFDGGSPVTASLGAASARRRGQVVTVPHPHLLHPDRDRRRHERGYAQGLPSQSAVGFAEVTIPGVPPATEVLRLPTDLLSAAGSASCLTRSTSLSIGSAAGHAAQVGPRAVLARQFTLPTARNFSIGGPPVSPPSIPTRCGQSGGRTAAERAQPSRGRGHRGVANSSGRLPGGSDRRCHVGGRRQPGHFVEPGLGEQVGNWVDFRLTSRSPSTTSTCSW